MAPPKPQRLDAERVRAFRAEVNAFIDAKAEEIRKTIEGVPVASIRHSLTRGIGCACAAFLEISEAEEKTKASEAKSNEAA